METTKVVLEEYNFKKKALHEKNVINHWAFDCFSCGFKEIRWVFEKA